MEIFLSIIGAFVVLVFISNIARYMLAMHLYNQQMKEINDGRPKAYYPPLTKPTLFFKRKK